MRMSPCVFTIAITAYLNLGIGCVPEDHMSRRLYLAIMARIMSPAFSAWSEMEPIISASLTK